MPIYEYKCQDCGQVTEVFVRSIHKEIDSCCSSCGSQNVKKIFSAPSAVVMGSSEGKGLTCCGQSERCDIPPCSTNGTCQRD